MFLKDSIERIIKVEPIFIFRSKKVFNSNSSTSSLKWSIIKKKKDSDRLHEAFYVEVLNNQKTVVISAFKIIFVSTF